MENIRARTIEIKPGGCSIPRPPARISYPHGGGDSLVDKVCLRCGKKVEQIEEATERAKNILTDQLNRKLKAKNLWKNK